MHTDAKASARRLKVQALPFEQAFNNDLPGGTQAACHPSSLHDQPQDLQAHQNTQGPSHCIMWALLVAGMPWGRAGAGKAHSKAQHCRIRTHEATRELSSTPCPLTWRSSPSSNSSILLAGPRMVVLLLRSTSTDKHSSGQPLTMDDAMYSLPAGPPSTSCSTAQHSRLLVSSSMFAAQTLPACLQAGIKPLIKAHVR
jgi:hypothetical protein